MSRSNPSRPRSHPAEAPAPVAPSAPWWAPARPYALPLLLLVLSRGAFAILLPFAAEDAYITFRYARSIAWGHGFSYNPGQAVFGFSSPLWTLWCALGIRLDHGLLIWTRASALIADAVTLVLVTRAIERVGPRAAAWAFAVFFAATPYFAAMSVSGMEVSWMLALVALGATLAPRRRLASGPVLGALAMVRPEGLGAAALLSLAAGWRDRLVALAIALASIAGLTLVFGSPLPQSMMAKASLYGTPGPWAGRHWWEWLAPGPLGRWPRATEGTYLLPLAVLFGPALVLGAARLWPARRDSVALAAGACLVVYAAYVALGVAYFPWYLFVPLAGLAIVAACGLPAILRGRAVYVALALHVLLLWTSQPKLYIGRAQNEFFGFAAAADVLRQHAQPGESVLLEPIGFVGWEAPVRVLDETGLVSPAIAARRLRGPGWYADVVQAERPDWLVVRRGVLESAAAFAGAGAPFRDTTERNAVVASYEFVSLADSVSGERALLILHRAR
jgi:hypothetical protein